MGFARSCMEDICLEASGVSYSYEEESDEAVRSVTLAVPRGSFVAVLGHNGSGKSTLAKLLNGLFLPSQGKVSVCGMDTRDEKHTWDIRRRAGMVFQNPDNQLVATMVREDVAFGLENIGVPSRDMPARIEQALRDVDMLEFIERAPHTLSGGQKQRIAIAGILAMQPEALILDEATAMLDPKGRREVFEIVRRLNRDNGITVLWITHFMEEAAACGRVVVMQDGGLIMDGTPQDVFSRVDELRACQLDVPPMARLASDLRARGIALPAGILTVDDMEREVTRLLCPSL
jgi:energy-coupling factor transport system ATP-binding protein